MTTPQRKPLGVPELRKKLATIRILFNDLSQERAQEAAKVKTGELNTEISALKQEALLTEMIHYDTCAEVIEALEKSLL